MNGITKYCKDCGDSISVSEFYIYGSKYSTYCREHTAIRRRATKKQGIRVAYAFNEPRPCRTCSPVTPMAPENFPVSNSRYRRNICRACIKVRDIANLERKEQAEIYKQESA